MKILRDRNLKKLIRLICVKNLIKISNNVLSKEDVATLMEIFKRIESNMKTQFRNLRTEININFKRVRDNLKTEVNGIG